MACTALYSCVNAPIHAVAYMTACCEKRPAVSGDCVYTLPKTRNSFTRPKTAIFSSTEEMKPDTGVGASAGCICQSMRRETCAAFIQKPTAIRIMMEVPTAGEREAKPLATPANSPVPV